MKLECIEVDLEKQNLCLPEFRQEREFFVFINGVKMRQRILKSLADRLEKDERLIDTLLCGFLSEIDLRIKGDSRG